jgi:predicted regulator of amino acid metabolism with ACT domain
MDTCSIISQKPCEPHRRKVYKTLWENVDLLIEAKEIVICSEIRDEIDDEELLSWLQMKRCEVIEVDNNIQHYVTKIVNEHPELLNFTNMKSSGDAFLIATAMKYGIAVITEENKNSPKKIPKICEAYNISCCNLTELAEKEGWKF